MNVGTTAIESYGGEGGLDSTLNRAGAGEIVKEQGVGKRRWMENYGRKHQV